MAISVSGSVFHQCARRVLEVLRRKGANGAVTTSNVRISYRTYELEVDEFTVKINDELVIQNPSKFNLWEGINGTTPLSPSLKRTWLLLLTEIPYMEVEQGIDVGIDSPMVEPEVPQGKAPFARMTVKNFDNRPFVLGKTSLNSSNIEVEIQNISWPSTGPSALVK